MLWKPCLEREHAALGFVEDLADRAALRIERVGGDLVAGLDQLAQDCALADDLGVAPQVGGAGYRLRQRVQVGDAAALLRLAVALQLLVDGDHVGRLARADQLADRPIDRPVLVAVEVTGSKQIGGAVPGQVIEQQAAQHALLGLGRVRRHAQARNFVVARAGGLD